MSKAIDAALGMTDEREVVGTKFAGIATPGDMDRHTVGGSRAVEVVITEAATPEAATPEAAMWSGWGTAVKPAWEPVILARKPSSSDSAKLRENLCQVSIQLLTLLSAKDAEKHFGCSSIEYAEACASAQWRAEDASNTRAALSALTDTSRSESVTISSLSTVLSWLSILDDLLGDQSTSTTETASSTTIALRTLSFFLSQITPLSIIQAETSPPGSQFHVERVGLVFAAAALNLQATRELSALALATDREHISSPPGVVPELSPIVLARKPFAGTVAANVQKHGTGALNIDATRILFASAEDQAAAAAAAAAQRATRDQNDRRTAYGRFENGPASLQPYLDGLDKGRWPANVLLDEEAAKLVDEQSGASASASASMPLPIRPGDARGKDHGTRGIYTTRGHDDFRGASRFFYVAKVSRAERNAGTEEMPAAVWTDGRKIPADNPRLRGVTSRTNIHPTVKPIDLMRYLIRLITPPSGVVLDPFLGSGSTGCAATLENCRFIGIEREPDYMRIAEARIAFWAEHGEDGLRICAERDSADRARAARAEAGQLDLLSELA